MKGRKPAGHEGQVFKLRSQFEPAGDQPAAIESLVKNYRAGDKKQTLLGVTGSGKTFTMAQVINQIGIPTIILAPNKTLAAQLFGEFKELFPENAVEYFVSYYDYYQPEAYVPSTDTYIEKDSAINEQIDRMRHSATRSLFERRDVIIVASVSCIYGLGSPEAYESLSIEVVANEELNRDVFLREMVRIQYRRNNVDFHRGTFRVRGDVVEVFPPYEEDRVIRVEFFGDYVEAIQWMDPITGELLAEVDRVDLFPASHYVNSEDMRKTAIQAIQQELLERLTYLKQDLRLVEAQRLEQRTYYDIEILEEMGFCSGIENYSRHFTGRGGGEPPPTLLEYFPEDFLCIIDESHVTVPQLGGMYRGDRARKLNLVEHGFRLPSALDNRPLNFEEFETFVDRVMYVSATPGDYEIEATKEKVVEQIIRPTGLLDPMVEVRPVRHQVDDLLGEIRLRIKKEQRVLVTTLTKRSAEDLTQYYEGLGIKVKYLHSDIKTVERTEIIRDLRLGVFDVLIGINLLREGLDIPEVGLVAITDADKEGFLRSPRSLIQTIGRAARNAEGVVILYADTVTDSMKKAMDETNRRRALQEEFNREHGIVPQTIKKTIREGLSELHDATSSASYKNQIDPIAGVVQEIKEEYILKPEKVRQDIDKMRKKMKKLAKDLEFEEAAKLRDEIKRLEIIELNLLSGEVDQISGKVIEEGGS